jgi:hypothetical protein
MSTDSLEQAFLEEPDLGPIIDESEPEEKYEFFLWDTYDWDKFDPKKLGYDVIRLMGDPNSNRRKSIHSGKYFTTVTRSMRAYALRVVPYWYPLVEYYRDDHGQRLDEIKRITAHNTVGPRNSRKVIYLHRILAEAEGTEIGDHINGYSLDNRNCNLRPVSLEINNHNVRRMRTAFPELWPGVEWADKGQTMVRGVISVAGVRIRSDIIWPLEMQEEAWKWVAKKKHELLGLRKTANGPITVPLPEPPPRLRRVFSVRTFSAQADDIPF